MFISQCAHLKKKENIQKSACLPIVQVRAFEHSYCLLFIPNRAKACYVGIVSVHNPLSYIFFNWQEKFPRWDFKGKQHINF